MLADRNASMASIVQMGEEIASQAGGAEGQEIMDTLQDLVERFDALTNTANARHEALEEAMKIAKEFKVCKTSKLCYLTYFIIKCLLIF